MLVTLEKRLSRDKFLANGENGQRGSDEHSPLAPPPVSRPLFLYFSSFCGPLFCLSVAAVWILWIYDCMSVKQPLPMNKREKRRVFLRVVCLPPLPTSSSRREYEPPRASFLSWVFQAPKALLGFVFILESGREGKEGGENAAFPTRCWRVHTQVSMSGGGQSNSSSSAVRFSSARVSPTPFFLYFFRSDVALSDHRRASSPLGKIECKENTLWRRWHERGTSQRWKRARGGEIDALVLFFVLCARVCWMIVLTCLSAAGSFQVQREQELGSLFFLYCYGRCLC